MHVTRPLAAALAAAALVLTGCATEAPVETEAATTSDAPAPAAEKSETAAEPAEATFNEADVVFAQQMIVHHQQAVDMAEMAAEAADTDELRELAAAVEAAQGPEIAQMSGWLEQWGAEVPQDGVPMGHMDHSMHGSDEMPGMMGEDAMEGLGAAMGAAFDEMWLTMMIEHHEGAIAMAEVQLEEGANPEAVELAGQVVADQTAEIAYMQELLGA